MREVIKKILNLFGEGTDLKVYMRYINFKVARQRERENERIRKERVEEYRDIMESAIDDEIKSCAVEALKVARRNKKFAMTAFPFYWAERLFEDTKIEVFEDESSMKYVLLDGKKMFFPAEYFSEMVSDYYKYTQIIEQDEKSTHRYVTEEFRVEEGDILVDVGACEGNFALAHIEKLKKVYLIECQDKWIQCLKKTFEPYMDKVVIIDKFVSDKSTDTEITLDKIFENRQMPTFIKADIEGMEQQMLDGASNLLKSDAKMKIALCVYHKNGDAERYLNALNNLGFDTEISNGYMAFKSEGRLEFRKGLVRAKKS